MHHLKGQSLEMEKSFLSLSSHYKSAFIVASCGYLISFVMDIFLPEINYFLLKFIEKVFVYIQIFLDSTTIKMICKIICCVHLLLYSEYIVVFNVILLLL